MTGGVFARRAKAISIASHSCTSPASRGAFPFEPAGLTAHIQYGAGSTVATPVDGMQTPHTGTKLKAPI